MDHLYKNSTDSIDNGPDSSVSSIYSNHDSAHSSHGATTTTTTTNNVHQRVTSYSPSYMNAKIPTRKPVSGQNNARNSSSLSATAMSSTRDSMATPPPPPAAKGILLLAIAANPHKSTMFYVQSMLKKRPYKDIVILGNTEHEEQLKKLKIDIYALLGKLGKEVAVQMDLLATLNESDICSVVSKAVADGETICGVLCTPSYSIGNASNTNIMNLDQDSLDMPWKGSVSFLHRVAKQAIPNFRSTANETTQSALFLVTGPTDTSPMSAINHAACRTVMALLVEAGGEKDLIIDYAENVLLPEPEVKISNGASTLPPLDVSRTAVPDEYQEPESPTKLWALYSEFSTVE